MSQLQYFDYPGFGERSRKEVHYSQAVRIGDKIEISGQGGWDRMTEEIPTNREKEIDQTFDNVEFALKQAGGTGFDQVYKLRIYMTKYDDAMGPAIVANLKRRFPKHQPLMTVIGVEKLYATMTVEIEAEAYLGSK